MLIILDDYEQMRELCGRESFEVVVIHILVVVDIAVASVAAVAVTATASASYHPLEQLRKVRITSISFYHSCQ